MWITLYDVSRDGIGIIPWFFALFWIAGIIGGVIAIKRTPIGRFFVSLWLTFWLVAGGVGMCNVFYQYAANVRALRTGSCAVIEGPVENLHRENPMRKGDSEHFVVEGHQFEYSSANLGGGGLRSSKSFRVRLRDGLYVKVWHRRSIICRLDTSPTLSTSVGP